MPTGCFALVQVPLGEAFVIERRIAELGLRPCSSVVGLSIPYRQEDGTRVALVLWSYLHPLT